MRITHINVKGLFGIFDHDIPLNTDSRITIIYGPNGYGKTFTLSLLNSIFQNSYISSDIMNIPFNEISVTLDYKNLIKLEKQNNDKRKELIFGYKTPKSKLKLFQYKPLRRENRPFPSSIFERFIPGIERIGPDIWMYLKTGEKLSYYELIDRFYDRLPHRLTKDVIDKYPEWLTKIKSNVHIRFIETQRLMRFSHEDPSQRIHAVKEYSTEIKNTIQKKLAEYAELSQSLDRTFPVRLVKGNNKKEFSLDELRKRLHELELKRTQLMNTGLLDKEEFDLRELEMVDESNRNVLSVYIEDIEKKLAVFDDLTNKIELLIRIVNSRFLQKRLDISKQDGFVFITSNGRVLQPDKLSSGEQHVVVLLYELLFKVRPDSLILIDEPELSLHIVWQQEFLRDLQDIIGLAGFDTLIATHSPQIIHDRWDLAVELKGPGE